MGGTVFVTFDMGVPLDASKSDNKQVVLLYNSKNAFPDKDDTAGQLSVDDATKNCDQLHVVLTQPEPNKRKQCLAVMGQYESFHLKC